MAAVKYNKEWEKIFESMGSQELPLFKRVATKALSFDMRKRYCGSQTRTVLVISGLTKIVNEKNEPESGYEQIKISDQDGFKCATMYFVPLMEGKPTKKMYAMGIKDGVGALIDYVADESYSFRYSEEEGITKIVKSEKKKEKPAEVIDNAEKKKKWFFGKRSKDDSARFER